MITTLWGRRPPPPLDREVTAAWDWSLSTVADVTASRVRLRAQLAGRPGCTAAEREDVLLAFEELASNGLRHGQPPVRVTVCGTDGGWQIDVTDAGTDRPPTPAVGRDAAEGGLGLYLVARLSTAHGWWVSGDRKHVWARLRRPARVDARPPTRSDRGPR